MMIDQLLRGLKHARRKRLKGDARIGTVSGFLKRMADVCGVEELAAALKLDKARVEGAIKRAAGQFTFFDAEHARPVASRYKGSDGKVVTKGTSLKDEGDGKALSDGSILEFDCVVTTGRRDRDGDVLDPKGAMVDPHLPLLWQHMPFQPIGKMVRLIEQSEDKVTARFKIMDTPLGREAATLIKGDCLRISHGFAPVEYNPLKDENGKDLGGWNITKYAMMECSVVSIPSNVDAEIEQFDAQKMSDPLIKAFYGALKDAGKRKAWAAGFGPVLKAAPAKKKPAAGKKEKDDDDDDEDKRKKEDEEEDRDEKADDDDDKEEKEKDDEEDEEEDDKDTDDQVEDEEKDDEEDDPESDEDGDGDSEENDSDSDASTDGGAVRPLGEIIDGINQLAADKSLPKEAQRRLMVVAGMFEDVDESIAGSADKLAEAAKARDLVSIFTEAANLTESCVAHIGRASDELERVMDVDELPDSAKGEIGAAVDDARNIMAAVSMMNSAAQDAQDEADQDAGDDEQADAEADGEADADADEEGDGEDVAVAESDGSDDDDDQDDEEEKAEDEDEEEDEDTDDEKGDEPEDEDEKDDDDEDRDEKGDDRQETDDDDENPEAEPAGEENPGTNSGKAARRRLSVVLGKKLLGQTLTEAERKLVKRHGSDLLTDD